MNFYLNRFSNEIKSIDETDYGDFMRKANAHLLELKEKIIEATDLKYTLEVQKRIDEIQLYLQYYPTWEIEPTRKKILNDIEELNFQI